MQKSLRNGCFDKMDKIKEDMIKAEERGEFKEWNLSDKILNDFDVDDYLTIEDVREFDFDVDDYLTIEDVREFVKRLKDNLKIFHHETGNHMFGVFEEVIDKLAGEKLCS